MSNSSENVKNLEGGESRLYDEGFVYLRTSKVSRDGTRARWECRNRRRKKCRATLIANANKEIICRSKMQHNHSPVRVIIEVATSTTDAPNPARGGSPKNKTTQFMNQTDERSLQGSSQPGPSQQSAEQNYDRGSGLDMLIAAAQVLDQGSAPLDTEDTSSHVSHTTHAQRPG